MSWFWSMLLALSFLGACGSQESSSPLRDGPQSVPAPEPSTSGASSPAAPKGPSAEEYLAVIEDLGALHTRLGKDCAALAAELEVFAEKHASTLKDVPPAVLVEIENHPEKRQKMRAAMTAVMDQAMGCRKDEVFQKTHQKLFGAQNPSSSPASP